MQVARSRASRTFLYDDIRIEDQDVNSQPVGDTQKSLSGMMDPTMESKSVQEQGERLLRMYHDSKVRGHTQRLVPCLI